MTDARQRVPPALDPDEVAVHHASVSFVDGMAERNKRLVVHHYATRSREDYAAKLARGAGDHKDGDALRSYGFFDALNQCDGPSASVAHLPLRAAAVAHLDTLDRCAHSQGWCFAVRSIDARK